MKFVVSAPYFVVLGIDFYLLPFFAQNTGMAIFFMLCVMPLIAFISAVIHGVYNGFSFILPAAAFLLFIPTIFIYYNLSAWIYAIVYAIIVLAGVGIGKIFYKKKLKNDAANAR